MTIGPAVQLPQCLAVLGPLHRRDGQGLVGHDGRGNHVLGGRDPRPQGQQLRVQQLLLPLLLGRLLPRLLRALRVRAVERGRRCVFLVAAAATLEEQRHRRLEVHLRRVLLLLRSPARGRVAREVGGQLLRRDELHPRPLGFFPAVAFCSTSGGELKLAPKLDALRFELEDLAEHVLVRPLPEVLGGRQLGVAVTHDGTAERLPVRVRPVLALAEDDVVLELEESTTNQG